MEQAVSGKGFDRVGSRFGEKVLPGEFKFLVGCCHRLGSCAFGGIEIATLFRPFDKAGSCVQRDVNSWSPGGVPERKREAPFCGASTGAASQGLTLGAERSAIVAVERTKGTDRIAKRLSGAMYRWFSCFQQLKPRRENESDWGASYTATSLLLIQRVLFGNAASQTKTETLTDLIRVHGLWFYL
jgi:hypothetical protein